MPYDATVGLCQECQEPYRHEEPQALPTVVYSKTETIARVLLRSRPPRTGHVRTEGNRAPTRP